MDDEMTTAARCRASRASQTNAWHRTSRARPADDQQASRAHKLKPAERATAGDNAVAAKKTESEKFQAHRIKFGIEHSKANAEKLYVGLREIKIERRANVDDIGFSDTEACSVVVFVLTGDEQVVSDAVINTVPTGLV